MNTWVRRGTTTLAWIAVLSAPAVAEDPEGSVSLWFRPGWLYADLGDANDVIRSGNERFAAEDLSTLGEFHNTFSVGAELHVQLHEKITAYGGYNALFGSKQKSFNRVVETKVSGSVFNAGALYRVPYPEKIEDTFENLDLFVGGGAVLLSGITFTGRDENLGTLREFLEERIFEGSGLGFELRLNLEYFLSPSFTLLGGATYRIAKATDLDHSVRVMNPNVFNPTGDLDGDGLTNDRDPDYDGGGDPRGNTQVMYGTFDGNGEWQVPDDRFLQSLYVHDPDAYANAPPEFRVYDPNAQFDLDLSGLQLQVGLSYYIF